MKKCYLEKWLLVGSVSIALFSSNLSVAQVVGDTTLPTGERSQVSGNPNFQIDGGARRGGNLFHSFQSFSVPTGGSAYFNNAADVQNIFTRVTGSSISNIDGVIRANGTANLFLLNPNGILFGAGASLNIGGSFIASTANSINFADNYHYSATNPQTAPLLTVSVPVGLQMGTNPGRIVVQGNGYDLSIQVPIFSPLTRGSNSTGLRVPVGRTLALIGGDIELVGGTLTAEQGRIELGSVRDGQVSLDSGFALSYPGVQTFGDIRLSQQALADASDGSIQVQGNNVSLTEGSLILIQNQGSQQGGSIRLNAVESLEISGTSPDGRIYGGLGSETLGGGSGADIAISTPQLVVWDGAAIGTRSYSLGKGGNVTVNASDSMQVIGFSPINPALSSSISSIVVSSGDAGNVNVSTKRLSILNGGNISSTTLGVGRGGDVTVNVTESTEVSGFVPGLSVPSNVSAVTLNAGDAGKVTISTSRLLLRNAGIITTNTFAIGNAGSVTIDASKSVEVSGTALESQLDSFVGSSAIIAPETIRQTYRLPPVPTGTSGDVTINTPVLRVADGAKVDVSNQGVGKAGILRVNANSIFLDTQGSITAATTSGEGGNINLNIRDVLLLRNNSAITTSAGGTGNGGNITIEPGLIVAIPAENSDIVADAQQGNGGNIDITTQGIFGLEFRQQRTPNSDITASSRAGVSGMVKINELDVEPSQGLTALPTNLVDRTNQLDQRCSANGANQENQFTVTGRGGLPQSPSEVLAPDLVQDDFGTLASETQTRRDATPSSIPPTNAPNQLMEAQGWRIGVEGKVILTASATQATPHGTWQSPANCQ